MTRASHTEHAQRLNAAIAMMHDSPTLADAAAALAKRYAMSERQAYRYLEQAKRRGKAVAVPDEKVVFTVKLPKGLVQQVRERANNQGDTLSDYVTRALTTSMHKRRGRG